MLGAVIACNQTVSTDVVWAELALVVKSRPEPLELNERAIEADIAVGRGRRPVEAPFHRRRNPLPRFVREAAW